MPTPTAPQPNPEPEPEPEAEAVYFPGLPDEFQRIIDNRLRNLLDEGWPADEAIELAALLYIDWHEADVMRKGGCPFQMILEILS